jgi:hypothetical protein
MMDTDLLAEITRELRRIPEARLVSSGEADALQQRVAQRFGLPVGRAWWWEHLRHPVTSRVYGQADGLSVLHESLPESALEPYLFLTDDNPPPWICVQGPGDALIRLLRELRFVECFLVDDSLSWIVFDTHHNSLVGQGALRISKEDDGPART